MKKNMKFFLVFCFSVAFIIGGMNFGLAEKKEEAVVEKGEMFKAGISLPVLNFFYLPFMRAIKKAVEEAGGEAIWAEASGYQVPKELQNVENLLAQDIDVLFIDICDSVASAPAIRAANEAGVPVVGLNQRVEGVDMITVIASDNYGAGKLAGEYLVEKLNEKGKILIINGPPVTAVLDRIEGVKDVLNKYQGMEIVGEQMMKNEIADGLYVAENMLAAHPDADGFFTMNDWGFLGAYAALEAIGKEKDVIITSVDGAPDVVALLAAGDAGESMTVAQFPIHIARGAVKAYRDYQSGKTVPPDIKVKVEVIDQKRASAGFHW